MAENTLGARIQLRYANYSQWMNSTVILKRGEAAIAAFPRNYVLEDLSNSEPDNTPPAIGIKIGDGINIFRDLPWVQGIASDVYNWAKQPIKPSYSAQEIYGLQAYVTEIHEANTRNRTYQLVEGTNDNENKYYLQYRDSDEDNWTIDTSSYIDLNDLTNLINWIGRSNINDYDSLILRNADQIRAFLNTLVYEDEPQTNYFVTEVSQSGGIVSVNRARPNFSNLSGSATVQQGGTGLTTIPEGEVLVGNGTNAIQTLEIDTQVAANTHLVNNNAVKTYVDAAVAGLEGAMHLVGEAEVEPIGTTDPEITNYNFQQARPGDVVLYNAKEYVWTGELWHLLGDEGSYAIKGSIVNADIANNAAIDQSKINGLSDALDEKVDKVSGKQLSTNDYTTNEKNKLRDIEEEAQVNIIEHILVNGTEISPATINNVGKTVNVTFLPYTQAEKDKLADIDVNASANTIEGITLNGTTQTPDNNKIVNLSVLEGAKYFSNNAYTDIAISNRKLELHKISVTGNIDDLTQTQGTYVILNCGTSTTVV